MQAPEILKATDLSQKNGALSSENPLPSGEGLGKSLSRNASSLEAGGFGKADKAESAEISLLQRLLVFTLFVLVGTGAMLAWYIMTTVAFYINATYLDGIDLGNSILGINKFSSLMTQVVLILIGSLRVRYLQLGFFLACVTFILLGPAVFYGSVTQRLLFLHGVALLGGVGNGLLQGAGFAIGSVFPVECVGAVALGHGVAGVVSNFLCLILALTAFDLNSEQGVRNLLWTTCGCTAVLGLLSMLLLGWIMNMPVLKRCLNEAKRGANLPETSTTSSALPGVGGPTAEDGLSVQTGGAPAVEGTQLRWYHIAWELKMPLLAVFASFFGTLNIFPRPAPLLFLTDNPPKDHMLYYFSLYCVFDLIGKWLLTLPRQLGWFSRIFHLKGTVLLVACFSRLLLYIPAFLAAASNNSGSIVHSFGFQCFVIVLIATSHGWLTSASIIWAMDEARTPQMKSVMGPCLVCSMLSGITLGLYIALAY